MDDTSKTPRITYLLEKIGQLQALKATYLAGPFVAGVVLASIEDLNVEIAMMEDEVTQIVSDLEAQVASLRSEIAEAGKPRQIWSGWYL